MSAPTRTVHEAEAPAYTDAEQIKTLREAASVFFSRPGPRLIAAKAGTAWALRLALGPLDPLDGAVIAGVAAWWPLQEWLMHKYLLHLDPRNGSDLVFARKHREHHVTPRDVDLTLLPLDVIKGAMVANVGFWTLTLGPTRKALTGIAAYSTMALLYEWTHYLVHTGYKPKSAFFKRVRKNHRLHHYRNENYWLSFTWPNVDKWLGTEPDPASVPHSKTVMDLFGLEAQAAADIPLADVR